MLSGLFLVCRCWAVCRPRCICPAAPTRDPICRPAVS
jgi:hypothetical protein